MKVKLRDLGFHVFRKHFLAKDIDKNILMEVSIHPNIEKDFYEFHSKIPNCNFFLFGDPVLFEFFNKNNITIYNLVLSNAEEFSIKKYKGYTDIWDIFIDISEEELFYIKMKYC